MKSLRTPDDRFANLPGYSFTPHYVTVNDTEGGTLRVHYVDEGPRDAPVVLLLHGEPSWSYLYRKMIPPIVAAGYRAIAPDLVGFGRSDKPTQRSDYSFPRHVGWIRSLIEQLKLRDMTLVCQDWGGLIGLRLAAEMPEAFARIVAANTMLPGFSRRHPALQTAYDRSRQRRTTLGFGTWFLFSQLVPGWSAGFVLKWGTARRMSPEIRAAYDAPYPNGSYMAGARIFPRLVPTDMAANKAAWKQLMNWQKPFLCAFSDKDPIMSAMAGIFPALIPGCQGQPHTTIERAGHFLQEDQGERLAEVVIDFVRRNAPAHSKAGSSAAVA